MPEHLALTLAAWLCCVVPLPDFDPGPHARAMVDPARERLGALAARGRSTEDLVRAVFGQVFTTELAESNDFVRRVAEYVAVIRPVRRRPCRGPRWPRAPIRPSRRQSPAA